LLAKIPEPGCDNSKRIISECEKQIESFDFNKKISMFLRTYYKEGFIKWFIENTKPAKTEIKIAQLSWERGFLKCLKK